MGHNDALSPHTSAERNVRFPLVERGEAPQVIDARLRDVAARLRIGHVLHKPPAQL